MVDASKFSSRTSSSRKPEEGAIRSPPEGKKALKGETEEEDQDAA
jgi:hypothetical protein